MRQSRGHVCQRPNIGSRVNREVHARFWERAEVRFLRATRHSLPKSPCPFKSDLASFCRETPGFGGADPSYADGLGTK